MYKLKMPGRMAACDLVGGGEGRGEEALHVRAWNIFVVLFGRGGGGG